MNSEQVKNMVLFFAMRNPNFFLALHYVTEKCKTEKEAKEGLEFWMLKEDAKKCLLTIFKKRQKNKL